MGLMVLFASEAAIRLGIFLSVFGSLAVLELLSPRLERDELRGAWKSRRWIANVGLVVLSSVLLRLIFPAAAVGAAVYAEDNGLGLLRLIELPPLLSGLIAFVVLDFAVWVEHVASHKIPLFWRFHKVHHIDTGFDVTTGLRFHPVEIVASMVWKAAVVIALGAPWLSVLIFEIVLNAGSMFTHSNVRLPLEIDRWMRRIVVTPDMHRVHHSTDRRETDSNYGFNLPIWDRLFGTYVPQPAAGHNRMAIGLNEARHLSDTGFLNALTLPFRQKKPTGK